MKRPRTGHVRPNLQGEAGIFQGVVPADVSVNSLAWLATIEQDTCL